MSGMKNESTDRNFADPITYYTETQNKHLDSNYYSRSGVKGFRTNYIKSTVSAAKNHMWFHLAMEYKFL